MTIDMTISRRAMLTATATAVGLLAGCGAEHERHRSRPHRSKPADPQSATPDDVPTRDAIVSRYRSEVPRQWGLNIPSITTRLPTQDRVVALTFDACGGPHGSGYNRDLIEMLRRRRIPATLFLNYHWMEANPAVTRELIADPLFDIGNHGTRHLPLSVTGRSAYGIPGTRDAGEVYDEVDTNRARLTELLGRPPRFFRPGTAYCDDVATRIVADLKETVVTFSVNGDAGATFTPAQVIRSVLTARPGSIVIGHMNRPASGTAPGMDTAVEKLAASGFRFVKLNEYLH